MCLEILYLIYMYKRDLVLNNLQGLICHKTKPNQTKPYILVVGGYALFSYVPFRGSYIMWPKQNKLW